MKSRNLLGTGARSNGVQRGAGFRLRAYARSLDEQWSREQLSISPKVYTVDRHSSTPVLG
ncbi:MAG TPA: hypothetical protein PLG17_03745 [Thermodesulfobacteriota bacterium]|nr:hypothetical protein [Deltaproteobacteria bacterium]HNR12853.1 hypothetical protein [Thermodesulfobacteriota bacterium]HNU72988.1 hypothetical protein [Thermodesulfobacteriota bacterium]HOC39153.1 hypothetical protein [Thermodesulfobacteriota bacterium]HQO77605.1 hypothetical protein [Thermodesulfobacteriota bacterium]